MKTTRQFLKLVIIMSQALGKEKYYMFIFINHQANYLIKMRKNLKLDQEINIMRNIKNISRE